MSWRSHETKRENIADKFLTIPGICAFLVVSPMILMVYLWQYFYVGTWLLAVSAFCIEVIIKVKTWRNFGLSIIYTRPSSGFSV
jgi:hypothetical protein